MGLFGLLFGGALLGTTMVGGVKHKIFTNEAKQRAIDEGKDWYTDYNGKDRLVINDEEIFFGRSGNGDYCMFLVRNGGVWKNYDSERRAMEVLEARYHAEEDCSVELIDANKGVDKETGLRGMKYRDKKTGRIFVRRKIGGLIFYVDVETRCVIRIVDYQKKSIIENPDWIEGRIFKKHNNEYWYKYTNESLQDTFTNNHYYDDFTDTTNPEFF